MAPKISPHPDAPIYVDKTFGGFVHGSVYDRDRQELVPCGWFWIGNYDGWTLYKADWAKVQDAMKAKAATQPAPKANRLE